MIPSTEFNPFRVDAGKLTEQERECIKTLVDLNKAPIEFKPKDDKIVSVTEWLSSYHYSGYLSQYLYPFWRRKMEEVFSADNLNFNEVVITGSLSSGKSTFAIACWARLLYMFSKMPDLQVKLGLAPTTRIFLAYLSVSQTEAELTGFGDFRNMIDGIPYFQEEYKRDSGKNSILEFPNGVMVVSGSDFLHFIGTALFSLIFDESNFVRKGAGNPGDVQRAFDIYHASRLRIKTRFRNLKSQMAGLNVLVSSSTHQTSFTEQVIGESRNDPKTLVIATKVYETKPEGTYSEQKFLFYFGGEATNPQVIKVKEDLRSLVSPDVYQALPELTDPVAVFEALPTSDKGSYCLVPIDFLDECERYPDRAMCDVIGHSQAAKNSFFTSKVAFQACINPQLMHPFSKKVLTVGVRDQYKIMDFFNMPVFTTVAGQHPLHIHVDQSTSNDSTGIACAHHVLTPMGFKVVVDFMLRIDPPGGDDKISITKCRRFIEDLYAAGFNIVHVTYDKFASAEAIQLLQTKGIKAEHFSTDASDEPWLRVADLMFLRALEMYEYQPFRDEWFGLEHDRVKRKIDHPKNNSKDVADGVCGAVYSAYMNAEGQVSNPHTVSAMGNVLRRMSGNNGSGGFDPVKELFGNVRILNSKARSPWQV